MNCPVCGSLNVNFKFHKKRYRILDCNDCSHRFADQKVTDENVLEIYSDKYFYEGGDGYSDYTLEGGMLIKRGEYYARKISKFSKAGFMLDVGAAAGFILKGFDNMGWKGIGIEPNKSMVVYGKEINGIDLLQGTFETLKLSSKFDLIIMIQVIAHLFDLNLSLKNASDSLKPGGLILIETWNSKSLTANIFGKFWHEYSPPSTLNFFNKKSLDYFMEGSDFHKIATGCPQKKILSNHAKSLVQHKMNEVKILKNVSGIINLIPDNVLLPYPAEDLFWTLYQKK